MNLTTGKTYAFCILLAQAVGALSAWVTREGVERFNACVQKPPLTPPSAVFPVVWTILFALMGVGAARVALSPPFRQRQRALALFLLQLGANFLWSVLFFNTGRYGLALLWLAVLWLLILAMLLAFRRVDRPAGWLQLPYLLWVAFAAYLNLGVWVLNR